MSFPIEPVVVRRYEKAGRDPYGAPIKEPKETPVENVLVAPGATSDLGAERPVGVNVAYTLYFPKTFLGSLENTEVKVRGEWYSVVGSPGYFDPTFCPTSWNRVVAVEAVRG